MLSKSKRSNTRASIQHMEKHSIRPKGDVQLLLPEKPAHEGIHRLFPEHDTLTLVLYRDPGKARF